MFRTLASLTKAAVGVAVAPVAVVVDIVKLPATAYEPNRSPFETTGKLLKNVERNIEDACDLD